MARRRFQTGSIRKRGKREPVWDLQGFVLKKHENGLGWGVCDHLRNLMSKVFGCAKKWGYFSAENPASAVELPEKIGVREKRVLMPDQIPPLLAALREPVRTMV